MITSVFFVVLFASTVVGVTGRKHFSSTNRIVGGRPAAISDVPYVGPWESDLENTVNGEAIRRLIRAVLPSFSMTFTQSNVLFKDYFFFSISGRFFAILFYNAPRRASVYYHNEYENRRELICGGSIITKQHILTAAHCVTAEFIYPGQGLSNDPSRYEIGYGEIDEYSTRNLIKAKKIKAHEDADFNILNFINDIAIVKLSKEIYLSPIASPIAFPKDKLKIKGRYVEGTVAGWGKLDSSTYARYLQVATVPVYNKEICSLTLGNVFKSKYHLCSGQIDGDVIQAKGDSGGPLVVDNKLHGVIATADNNFDGPGLCTKVYKYYKWIKKNIEKM